MFAENTIINSLLMSSIIPITVVTIFHEVGHYVTALYYGLNPRFIITKRIRNFPRPAVEYDGEFPNRWALLSGLIGSFFGFPVFYTLLFFLGYSLFWFSLVYLFLCFIGCGFEKDDDFYEFRHFKERITHKKQT